MTEESKMVEVVETVQEEVVEPVVEDVDAPTYALNCHWTESEWMTYELRVSKWENKADWNYLAAHEPMMPFVYKLQFKDLLDQLESDKNSMSLEDVFEKYTGERDLV